MHKPRPIEYLSFGIQKSFAGDDGKRYVEGLASTENEDWQGETAIQQGIDFSYLQKGFGRNNWDHEKGNYIGDVVFSEMTPGGLFVRSLLYQPPKEGFQFMSSEMKKSIDKAVWVWEYSQMINENGGHPLAYSIEGPPPMRYGKRIVKSLVSDVAITNRPVNTDCTISALIKSLNNYMQGPGLSVHDIRDFNTFTRYMEDHGVSPGETVVVAERLKQLLLGE